MLTLHKVLPNINWAAIEKSEKTGFRFSIFGSKVLDHMHTFWSWKWSQLWVVQVKNTTSDKPYHFDSRGH